MSLRAKVNAVLECIRSEYFHATKLHMNGMLDRVLTSIGRATSTEKVRQALEENVFVPMGKLDESFAPGARRHSFTFDLHPVPTIKSSQSLVGILRRFDIRPGYVAIHGDVDYSRENLDECRRLHNMLATSRHKKWVIDLSRFTGGSDAVACTLLCSFFKDPCLGYYVGRTWIAPIHVKDKLIGISHVKTPSRHVTVLISQSGTFSAGEFTAAYLKTSLGNLCRIVSVDPIMRSGGGLSVNTNHDFDDIGIAFPTAYYAPTILKAWGRSLKEIVSVAFARNRTFKAVDAQGRVVAASRSPIQVFVSADRSV